MGGHQPGNAALTVIVLGSGGPPVREGDPISFSSYPLVADRGPTLSLEGVIPFQTLSATLEIFSTGVETDARLAVGVPTALLMRTAITERSVRMVDVSIKMSAPSTRSVLGPRNVGSD